MIDYERFAEELRAREPGIAASSPQIDDEDELEELVREEEQQATTGAMQSCTP